MFLCKGEIKMRRSGKILTGAMLLFGMTIITAQPAHATVIKNSFLKTQRTITTYNSKKQVKLTIPKGTTDQARQGQQVRRSERGTIELQHP